MRSDSPVAYARALMRQPMFWLAIFFFIMAALVRGQNYPYPVDVPLANTPNGPQCTQVGWYIRSCDAHWQFVNPGMAGHVIPNGCAAHTQLVYGGDGAQYPLIDQCPQGCTGTQGLYKKPSDPIAVPQWEWFYVGPLAAQHRSQFGYVGPGVPPAGTQTYSFITLAQMPDPPRATFIAAYQCSQGTPTPVPSPTRTPTPSVNQFWAQIEAITRAGISAGCGSGNFCPDRTMTRGEVAAWLANALKLPLLPCQGLYHDVGCPVTP